MNSDPSVSRRGFLRAATGAAAVAGATGSVTAQESGATHTVDMTDELIFDPEEITIAPGDTVVWENVGNIGHSVTAYEDDIPEGADFFASGGFDAEQAARDGYPAEGNIPGGESYEHTFETTGTYEYFCIPHESVGMVGTITVQEGGAEEGGGGGAAGPSVPETAKTVGVAAVVMMLATLGIAYGLIKYGGGPEPE